MIHTLSVAMKDKAKQQHNSNVDRSRGSARRCVAVGDDVWFRSGIRHHDNHRCCFSSAAEIKSEMIEWILFYYYINQLILPYYVSDQNSVAASGMN